MSGSGLVAIALVILGYAAVSRRLSSSPISAAMVFVAGGVIASDASSAGSTRPSATARSA